VDNSYVDLEWNGKEFKKRIDELIDRNPVAEAAASKPAAAAKATAHAPAAQAISSSSRSGPGIDVGGGLKGCVPGDSSPDGTVVDGMKKIVTATPFGSGCRWEPTK
jgi:hypothetical protein